MRIFVAGGSMGLFGVGFWRGEQMRRHGTGKMKCDKHFGLPEKKPCPAFLDFTNGTTLLASGSRI
jgi:hypothetical protein